MSVSIDEIKISEKICKYIFQFLFLLFNRSERGIKKIKTKISSMSELFNPIRNKKK